MIFEDFNRLNFKPITDRERRIDMPRPAIKINEVMSAIIAYLDGQLIEEGEKISTKRIKRELDLPSTPSMTFTRAVRKLSETSEDWELDGRSMVRISDPADF